MKLREDEREVRKTLIMKAAMKLFDTKLFHEIGMRDIAKEAGVSAATIYRYFPSRDDLFVESIIKDINNIEHLIAERQKKTGDNKVTIEDLAIITVDYLIDNEAFFQMLCHFMITGGINPRVMNKFNAVQIYFYNMFTEVLGTLGVSEPESFYTHAFFASLAGVVMTFRNYPGRSKEEKRKYMHTLALLIMNDGLSTESTKKIKGGIENAG